MWPSVDCYVVNVAGLRAKNSALKNSGHDKVFSVHRLVLLLVVVAACSSSSPPPRDVFVVAPVKPIVSASVQSAVSALPNPPPPATSAPPADPPELPDSDTMLVLGNGTSVFVVLSEDASSGPPELALELRSETKVILRREGWQAITHVDLKKLAFCDTWYARLGRESLGDIDAVRVSLVCRAGEDYMTSKEVAVLVKPDTLETIWAGLADSYENSMDSCLSGIHVKFRFIKPKTLEKTIVEETHWVDQLLDEEVKGRLKRDCKVGSKRRVERVKLL